MNKLIAQNGRSAIKKLFLAALLTASVSANAVECLYIQDFVTATMKARQKGVDKHKMTEHAILMRNPVKGLELIRAIRIAFNSPIDTDPKALGYKSWLECLNETYEN